MTFFNSFYAFYSIALLSLAYGVFIERFRLEKKKFSWTSPHFDPHWEGLKFAHLSDIHLDFYFPKSLYRRLFELLNRSKPDVLFLTGDFISKDLGVLELFLKDLKKNLPKGRIIAIPGNHDHRPGLSKVIKIFKKQEIPFLTGESLTLETGLKNRLRVFGIDTLVANPALFKRILKGVKPEDFNILLIHDPDLLPLLPLDFFDLVLAGHTHGYQVDIPFLNFPHFFHFAPSCFMKGVHSTLRGKIFIHPGVGVSNFPARFRSIPSLFEYRVKNLPLTQ